ncbi:MAG TPA: energy transducer TonB [Ramlibacter sp.]|nr:energy transducer TonB [Ramlibacter sp.]
MRRLNRNFAITGSVVLFHIAALWALQNGLLRRAMEVIVPVQMLSEMVAPPAPKTETPPEPPKPRPQEPVVKKVERPRTPAPQPLAIPDTAPAPNAPTGVVTPQPPVVAAAPGAPAPAPAPPAPAKLELPTSTADYLHNPKPAYPSFSKRMGEQGKVVLRVYVTADGKPEKVELKSSSGFERLDKAAIAAVSQWRFVPGKRGGVPESAWAPDVPIIFNLEEK